MSGKLNNPPAFPVKVKRNTSSDPLATPRETQMEGMTLRDWFAGQALAGEMAAQSPELGEWTSETPDQALRDRAALLYRFADAMLAERERRK